MALRLNPVFEPIELFHTPEQRIFPKFSCPSLYVPLDKIHQIAVVLSSPPAEPFDIQIVPLGPPALPFDIAVIHSKVPALPLDIETIPSAEPTEPFDIQTVSSSPPVEPFDIITIPLEPLPAPFDIPTPLSSPPSDGPVMTPEPPHHEDNPYDIPSTLVVEEPRIPIGTDVRRFPPPGQEANTIPDRHEDIVTQDINGQTGYPPTEEIRFHGGYLDPRDDINLQANLLGLKGVLKSAAKDLVDPFRLIKLGIQLKVDGVGAFKSHLLKTKIERANPFAETHSEFIDATDGKFNNSTEQTEIAIEALEQNNKNSPSAPYVDNPRFSLKELNGLSKSRDNNAAFTRKKTLLSLKGEARARISDPLDNKGTYFGGRPNSNNLSGQIPAKFPNDGEDGSIVPPKGKAPHDVISDSEAYVPLSFTDLRPIKDAAGGLRTVYFRPFITSLTEDFSPEWDKKTLFGRNDQVVNYMSTVRTVFVGFELHAFYPDDLEIMYKKLNWLSSMVYPEYDNEMLLKSGPVCRMRIGDVISGNNKLGLSGIIDSLSYDYTDSIWDVEEGTKAPRSIKVSISFHALHETPIGRDSNGNFGGITNIVSTFDNTTSTTVVQRSEKPIVETGFFRGFGNTKVR